MKAKKAQIRLLAALGHAAVQRLQVFPAFLRRALPRRFAQRLATEHFLQVGRRLASLGTVGFVDDYGAMPGDERSRSGGPPLLCHFEQLPRDKREFLQRRDDHRNRTLKRFGELSRVFVDPLHDATLVLKLVNRVLELLVQYDAVRHHEHAIEDALVVSVVQGRETMRQPTDRVAFAAPRGMLNEVIVA